MHSSVTMYFGDGASKIAECAADIDDVESEPEHQLDKQASEDSNHQLPCGSRRGPAPW